MTILARDFPTPFALVDPRAQIDYTSPWGGAHNRWVPPRRKKSGDGDGEGDDVVDDVEARDHRLALATFRRMTALARARPEAGVTCLRGVEFLERPGDEYVALAGGGDGPGSARALGIEGFRLLAREEFPDDRVALGFEYDTWCVSPMVYCSFLLNRFVYRGGKVVKRVVRDPREVFEMRDLGEVDTVVNASGQGFGDEKVFITRGMYGCLIAERKEEEKVWIDRGSYTC